MENDSSRQIRRGAIISYLVIIFNMIAGLVYTPWMISQIGQEYYGLYTLATSFISMFMVDFGMSAATARFISKYIAEDKQEVANNFLGLVYKLYLVIDAIIVIILAAIYFYIEKIYIQLSPNELIVFKNLYLIVGLFSVITFPFVSLNGILTSYEKYVPLKLCDLFHKLFIIVTVIVVLTLGGNIYALVLINAVSGILTTLIKLIVVHFKTPIRANMKYFDKNMLQEMFGFSIWTTVGALAQRMIYNLTPSIIAAFSVSGSVGVAVFGLSSTIEGYIYSFSVAISGLFMPRISRMVYKNEDRNGIMNLAIRVGRIQCYVIGLLVVGFIAVGQSFIVDIWNKPDFRQSYICAIMLILPSYFYLPMEIMNTALVVENRVKLQAYVFLIMGTMNAVVSIVLSKFLGAIGASLSILLAYTVRTILMVAIYQKNMHFDMRKFFRETFVKVSPALLVIMVFGLSLEKFNPLKHDVTRFLINGGLVVLVAMIVIWSFVMDESEKKLVQSFYARYRR